MEKDLQGFRFVVASFYALQQRVQRNIGCKCRHRCHPEEYPKGPHIDFDACHGPNV